MASDMVCKYFLVEHLPKEQRCVIVLQDGQVVLHDSLHSISAAFFDPSKEVKPNHYIRTLYVPFSLTSCTVPQLVGYVCLRARVDKAAIESLSLLDKQLSEYLVTGFLYSLVSIP